MKVIDPQVVRRAVVSTFDKTAARIHEIHGRYWEGRLGVTKAVLTLTSAILAGTISFAQPLIGTLNPDAPALWMLKGSWSFFAFSLLAALAALWYLYRLNSVHPALFNSQAEISKALEALGPKEDERALQAGIDEIVSNASNKILVEFAQSDKYSHAAAAAQLSSYHLAWAWFFSLFLAYWFWPETVPPAPMLDLPLR